MAINSPPQSGTSKAEPIQVHDGQIMLIDQRKIPETLEYFDATALDDMCFAIKEMVVRGAPAIGAAGALGLACEARRLALQATSRHQFYNDLEAANAALQSTRPTAVNLSWDTNLVFGLAQKLRDTDLTLVHIAQKLFDCARSILEGYVTNCRLIGEYGAELVGEKASILTHCNAGALATCGWGTALGVIRAAHLRGCQLTVFVDETRPRQQGSRLTAWELLVDGIEPTLITDTMAGYLMSQRKVDLIVTGADRIAVNGDTANKIGTYTLAVLAQAHSIPMYIAAPLSTIDPALRTGEAIPIEQRDASEVTIINGKKICPPGIKVLNPAFDVTPNRLITAIITEAGILRAPYEESIGQALASRTL